MADYTDRFTDAARALGLRYFEETGARDVWDEVANFNDEDMSITDYLLNAGSVAWQVANAPLNFAANLAIEANRGLGAAVLSAKPGNTGNAWMNYATAWTPPTPSETEPVEGEEFAPGIYTAATAGDLLVMANDRLVANLPGNKFVNRRAVSTLGFPLGGAGYVLGTLGQPEGPYKNGTYISPTFDITTYNAGDQIRNSYLRTVQTIGNVSLEAVIDPLNWVSGPIGAGIAGLSAKKLVTVPGALTRESLTTYTDLMAAARTNRVLLRNSQRPPGIGMWSQQQLFQAMNEPGMKEVVRRLVENKDAGWATNFFLRNEMAQGDAAAELGKLSSFINDERGMWDLFNAAAYRNVESINNLKRIVINNTPLNNSMDTLLGTGDNLFDQALVDFPIGSVIPDGHILNMDAGKFLENALNENPAARIAWDKFAADATEEAVKAKVAAFKEAATSRKGAIEVMEKMFPAEGRVDNILMQVPTERTVERALRKADPEWLAYGKTSAIRLPGGSHRFAPKFLLLARPGLTFKLHGMDAITKFDDMIKYANGLIGSTLKNADGTPYQFALDPETLKIRAAFLDAGTDRKNPEQLRAAIVNMLQKHVLSKIAEDAGFDYEVASHLAEAGMVRADTLNSALLSANKGYMSTVNDENGVITVLANHPTTGRQAANFVPIMDWAGVRRALHSRPMGALTDPENIASVVKMEDPGLKMLLGKYPVETRRDLSKFGRVETPVGKIYHGLVDISDIVRQIFTHSVLLRLGYPVRNLAEGTLSTTGSGVGLINVLSKMDFASLLGNHFSNVWTMFPRAGDRMQSYFGIINNERALEAAIRQVNHSINISSDTVARMLYLVTEKTTISRLEEIITTSTKPELVAEAEKSLKYLTELKLRLAKGLDEEFVVTDELKELTGVAQRLYHTDTNGWMNGVQDEMDESIFRLEGKLKRPLSTTPQSTIAQMHVDAAYSKAMFGEPVPGAPQWATRRFGPEGDSPQAQWAEAKARMVELRKTHKIEYRMSTDDNWAPYTHYTKYVEGVTDKFEFRAIPREGMEPRVLAIDTWGKELDLRKLDWDARAELDKVLEQFPDLDEGILQIAGSGRRFSDMDNIAYLIPPGAPMEGEVFYHGTSSAMKPGDVIKPSLEGGSPIKTFDYKTYTGDNRYAFATRDKNYAWEYANTSAFKQATEKGAAREHVYVVRPLRGGGEARPVLELSEDEVRILADRYPVGAPLDGFDLSKDNIRILTERGKSEILKFLDEEADAYLPGDKPFRELRQKIEGVKVGDLGGAHGRDGRPLGVSEWNDEVIADGWVVVKEVPMMTRREARERVSEVLAKHGVYRTVWEDSGDWGGVNVLIHPKAIGNRGLAHAIDDDIRERVARAAARGGPDTSAIPKPSAVLNKRLPGQMVGKPIDPTYHGKLSKVLENGGFEKIMDDAIAERIKLVRQKAALQTALDQRRARVAQVSKKRGRATPNLYTTSRYKAEGHYVNANMLAGHNGYAYANYSSADETTSLTISGNLYRQDLLNDLRRSFMEPRDITPDDPMYWEGFANLLGRMYRDLPGAEDMAAIGVKSMDDIDPIVRMALQRGDRERLRDDAVDWALHTKEGHEWVRTLDLAPVPSGTVDEALELGAKEAAYRGTPKPRSRASRRNKMDRKDWRESQGGRFGGSNAAAGEQQRIEIADVITAQFNFVDNYMLDNPEVARLFLEGKATAENLRKAHEANPWELKPFNGLLSPTSAEYKQARLAAYDERGTVRELSDSLLDAMSGALRAIGSQPETRMLRHPVFETVADLDFQQRVTHAENTLGRALSLAEQADLRARSQAFALTKIKDTLYTLESRSTLDDYLRFVAPFFPAWVNAASRWGKFYLRNPANPGKIASRITSIANNTVLVDENGEPVEADGTAAFDSYLVIPFGAGNLPFKQLSDLVNKMWPGAAEVMNKTYIPLRSIDVIFQGQPGNPGFGPWVTVPTQYLLNKRDDWFQNEVGKWIVKQIMPVGPTASGIPAMDYVQHFLPTGVRRIIDNALKDKAWYSQYSKNKLMLISMQAEGTWTGTPQQMEDDAIELTRFSTWVRIASSFVSPVAQQQRGEPEYYASRWREFRDETGSADEADRKFYQMYPAQWVLSQGLTSNLTGGMASAITTANQRSTEDLARVAAQLDAPELLGFSDNYQPDGELPTFTTEDYNPYSRRWQMYNNPAGFSENYRISKSVEEVAREAAVDEGWMMYQQVEAAVSGRLVAQGYRLNSYEFQKAKQDRMTVAAAKLAEDYPQWGLARGEMNTAKNERNAIYFKYTLNNKDWMAGKEDHLLTQSMREYLIARDAARAGMERQGDAKSSTAKANEQWNAALAWKREQLSMNSPAFKEWVDRYFRNDIVSVDDITLMEGAS